MQCGRCNRALKSAKSVELGFGPTCHKKHQKELADAEFLKNQITLDEVMKDEGASGTTTVSGT